MAEIQNDHEGRLPTGRPVQSESTPALRPLSAGPLCSVGTIKRRRDFHIGSESVVYN